MGTFLQHVRKVGGVFLVIEDENGSELYLMGLYEIKRKETLKGKNFMHKPNIG